MEIQKFMAAGFAIALFFKIGIFALVYSRVIMLLNIINYEISIQIVIFLDIE